jgi:molybdopterin molybdotransferase
MPAELGLLGSLGIAEVRVRRRLRVAFFSTGDELRSLGEALELGDVYDSNRYTLYGMLTRLGVELIDLGVIRDEPEAVRAAFNKAAELGDAVISTGGASTGEADYIGETLARLGEVRFWRIAIRPGRPLAFGRIGEALFFGLPGNPVAVMVTFYQFVQPALLRMMGSNEAHPNPMLRATCLSPLRKRPGRVEVYRAILARDADGRPSVRGTGKTGSGLLHTMSDANCFIVLGQDAEDVEAGAEVDVQPFFGLV